MKSLHIGDIGCLDSASESFTSTKPLLAFEMSTNASEIGRFGINAPRFTHDLSDLRDYGISQNSQYFHMIVTTPFSKSFMPFTTAYSFGACARPLCPSPV